MTDKAITRAHNCAVGQKPSLLVLLVTFVRIGLLSFGGSSPGLIHHEVVEKRGWIDEKTYLTGLTIAEVLPGSNPVDLALYIGLHLRGGIGATIAVIAMVAPAFCVILVLGLLYSRFSGIAALHAILGGMAAAGVGVTLSVGLELMQGIERKAGPVLCGLATFVTIGVLHWPTVPVVIVVVPLSISATVWQERRSRHVQ